MSFTGSGIKKILITGGAGFVGSRLAKNFISRYEGCEVTVFDNLRRRGSELNLSEFKKLGINFVHGDIRELSDLMSLDESYDLFIEASAEPSVHAGTDGNPSYLINTNLAGTLNCLDFAKKFCEKMIFLSTSRVYSIPDLIEIPLREKKSRFVIDESSKLPRGLTFDGINEDFNTRRFRSLYGATKLASELVIQEYVETFGMDVIINRCGVIAGAGQWGKVDQGVFTLWVVNHFFKKNLKYTGFNGTGKQVRDLLHPDDLFDLIEKQISISSNPHSGEIFNVGGGKSVSTSMKELTVVCEGITGNKIDFEIIKETSKVDIPYYVTDYSKVSTCFEWRPKRSVRDIVEEIYAWLQKEEKILMQIFK